MTKDGSEEGAEEAVEGVEDGVGKNMGPLPTSLADIISAPGGHD